MSVAFRRESDEEHLEPKFELPVPPGPNPVTERGYRLIEAKVTLLEAGVQVETDDERRKGLVRELRYWRTRLASAEIVAPRESEKVVFGSRVRFRREGREQEIVIVGHDEADRDKGTVSQDAPLARALIGGVEGDLLPFAGREDAIEVLEVGLPR
ncbi:GreA/GreB family elongation factor [Sphingomonas sp. BIUV-7]|uniref:GreA/GreB family elongation factor n=1 Tax=Sphingomonas natans TaxID=3063330 RepID=A0ABT8YDV7_9SPHN|nr:GreA/GreB family elongation factor [Sphingomonas sp. BIUV-7]MDO6416515.1 GreA/GreB family elongation factor [Sphingomonas sp. BIUV-7]